MNRRRSARRFPAGSGPRRGHRRTLAFEVFEARALLSATTATRLVVTMQPPAAVAVGAGFCVAIAAEDDSGTVATGADAPVTVSLAGSPGGGMLTGRLTAALVDGEAVFTGLTVD